MKKMCIFFVLISCTFLIFGCGTSTNKSYKGEEVDLTKGLKVNDIKVFDTNYSISLYNDVSSQRNFFVDLISKKKIDENKIKFNLGEILNYSYSLELCKNEKIDLETYLKSINKNIEKLSNKEKNEYTEKMKKAKITKIYHYKLYVKLKDLFECKLKKGVLEYNSKKYFIDLNGINLYEKSDLNNKKSKGVDKITVAASDVIVKRNNKGIKQYYDNEVLKTKKDIDVKKIYSVKKSVLGRTILIDNNSNNSASYLWDDDSIKINKGSTLGVDLEIKDKKIKENKLYQGNEYMAIDYICEGKQNTTYWEINFCSGLTGYQLCVLGK